jgi:hypothetical protein
MAHRMSIAALTVGVGRWETEAAHYPRVKSRTVLKWAKEGRIPAEFFS